MQHIFKTSSSSSSSPKQENVTSIFSYYVPLFINLWGHKTPTARDLSSLYQGQQSTNQGLVYQLHIIPYAAEMCETIQSHSTILSKCCRYSL